MDSALPQPIADALARGTTVLTANHRAARTLVHDFNREQQARGRTFWEPPTIMAWDAWLGSLWQRMVLQGDADEMLLNSTQEQSIWRAIISADSASIGLHPVEALARTAAEAWMLLHQYRGRRRLAAYPGNRDTRAYAGWLVTFERRCARSNYVTQTQLPERLALAISGGRISLPVEVLLVGFDSRTPTQIALIEAVRSSGTSVTEPAPPPLAADLTLADATDEYTEIDACAHWLRTRLTQHPHAVLAVIVPDIDSCREQIDRQFRTILAPELNNITADSSDSPYEFSLGVALARTALASTALDILRWSIGPLTVERVSSLLLSAYFANKPGSENEMLARAEFDAFGLRRQHLLQPSMTVDQLLQLASKTRYATGLPGLIKHLRQLSLIAGKKLGVSSTRPYAEWAETFHQLLDAAGFAPPASLDSIQFQTRRKWEGALDELTTLDFDAEAPPVNFAGALGELTRIAEETLFAPESRHASVQIMGALESAGATFDATWFLRANDLAWPAVSNPNPLLPWQMQRDLQMPGADSQQNSIHARRVVQRIASSAHEGVFSYAHESADGQQRPSSSLSILGAINRQTASALAPAIAPRRPIPLESLIDDTPIPFPPDRVLPGGATILRTQAACGFRAFAEMRLFSTTLDSLSLGLDASERGNLIHTVLENFWTAVQTQAALKRMTNDERDNQLNRSIDVALQRHYAHLAPGWPRAYIDAERQRTRRLLTNFLVYEANQRRPFTVQAREQQLSDVRIGPLRLDVRVDRIDTVEVQAEDGTASTGAIIIDYKTGKASPSDWQDDRPNEPQLPLYAIVSGASQLAGVAFASIRPGKELGLNGYESQNGILPKTSKMPAQSLAAQVRQWRDVLESLAEDFYRGEAKASPKKYPGTCKYCEQRLLCRLNVSALADESREDESGIDVDAEADLG